MKSKLTLIIMMAVSIIVNSANGQSNTGDQAADRAVTENADDAVSASSSKKDEHRGRKNRVRKYELMPMTVFPETVDNNISISIPFSSKDQGKVNIYTERGEIVHYEYFDNIPNTFDVAIPETLAPGKYFIQVIAEDKHAIQKFIKN